MTPSKARPAWGTIKSLNSSNGVPEHRFHVCSVAWPILCEVLVVARHEAHKLHHQTLCEQTLPRRPEALHPVLVPQKQDKITNMKPLRFVWKPFSFGGACQPLLQAQTRLRDLPQLVFGFWFIGFRASHFAVSTSWFRARMCLTSTQRPQDPFVKKYPLNMNRIPNMI